MSAERSDTHRLACGRNPEHSRYWMAIAAVLLVAPPILLGLWWVAASGGTVSPGDLASGLTAVVLGVFLGAGSIGAMVQAYLNGGALVSVALAVSPVVGLAFFVGDALYVVVLLGGYALVAGVVAFVVGAGARRMVGRLRS
jgi:hypothetical protein